MSAVIQTKVLSRTIVRDLFRDGMRTAVAAEDITDPAGNDRPSKSKFVVTAFPDRDIHYPIVVAQEAGDSNAKLDARTGIYEHDPYLVRVTISARNKTQLYNLRDEVRSWVEGQHSTWNAAGFMDSSIRSSGEAIREDSSDTLEWSLLVGGRVFTVQEAV